jgi:small subunit ribosomal protein S6
MRRYETIFILRPNSSEEEINRIIDNTSQVIGNDQGSIIEMNRWGMKKLAYLIKKESLGYYVFCDYAATPAAVNEIERKFRIDDAVLKYLTIKIDESMTAEKIAAAITEVSAKATESAEDDPEEEDLSDTDGDDDTADEEE